MAILPQTTWSGSYRESNPPDIGNSLWKIALADWIDSMLNGLIQLNGMTGPGLQFTFDKETFLNGLSGVTSKPPNGIQKLSDAWFSAMNSSTWVVPAGSSIGAPSPTTTFGPTPPPVATPDASTLTAGKNKILELLQAPSVTDPAQSQFPIKLREATIGITVSTVGVDSTPTPAGPLAINDLTRAVI